MVSSASFTPRLVTQPAQAFYRFRVGRDAISAPAPKLSDCHPAIMKNILTDLDYACPLAGFTPGTTACDFAVKGHEFVYTLHYSFIRTPRFGTPAEKTDVFLDRLMAILGVQAKGLTIECSISPAYGGEALSYEQTMIPNPNFDGVLIELRFGQFSIR